MSELGSGRRIGRVVMEIGAIVLSILLAFAIDAGWDSRGERLRELQILRDLHAEFLLSEEEIHGAAETFGDRAAALEVLGGIATGRLSQPSPDSLTALLSYLMLVGTMDPRVPTLEGLKGAGEIDLLGNDQLRGILALWDGDLRDAKEAQAFVYEATIRDVYGWLRQHALVPNPFGMLPEVMLPQESADLAPYLTTGEFQSLVAQQYVLSRLLSGDAIRQAATASEILEVLEAELAADSSRP